MPPRGLHAGGIESCGIRQLIVISECEPIEPVPGKHLKGQNISHSDLIESDRTSLLRMTGSPLPS